LKKSFKSNETKDDFLILRNKGAETRDNEDETRENEDVRTENGTRTENTTVEIQSD
jgi:hypothetical protein